MEQPEVFTLRKLVEKVEKGEKMLIHTSQFFAFMTETELLRLPFCIKTSVVGEQVVLEQWDIGGIGWADGAGGNEDSNLS